MWLSAYKTGTVPEDGEKVAINGLYKVVHGFLIAVKTKLSQTLVCV